MEKLRYPIGLFDKPSQITAAHIDKWVADIKSFPQQVNTEVEGLNKQDLSWIYRPGGWSIQQLIHHCADSHMNAFIRFKLAITEEKPTIRPYMEDRWAKLPDTLEAPIEWSLQLLEGLHARWTLLLENLNKDDLNRSFIHPEHGAELTIEETIGSYAWHSNHHLAHIRQAKEFKGQF